MPYVPSFKTMSNVLAKQGITKSVKELESEYQSGPNKFVSSYSKVIKESAITNDRATIDEQVVLLAKEMAEKVTTNYSVRSILDSTFISVVRENALGKAIRQVAEKYNYEGAYLGELNYAITRLIQEFPKAVVKTGKWKEELRYWLYAIITESLIKMAQCIGLPIGVSGVFEDIKDEYKVRVNEAYEHVQIKKSGDCYDAPYYSRVMDVVDKTGKLIGTVKVNMVRSDETLNLDILPTKLVAE